MPSAMIRRADVIAQAFLHGLVLWLGLCRPFDSQVRDAKLIFERCQFGDVHRADDVHDC